MIDFTVEDLARLKKEMAEWMRAGTPLATSDQRGARFDLCKACEYFSGSRCAKCNCFMFAKTWLATARCPVGKWEPVSFVNWFFAVPDNAIRLVEELVSWRGTRFFPQSAPAVKGVRADCVSFVEAVLVNVGAIPPIKWPEYVTRSGGEPMRDLLLKTMDGIPNLVCIASAKNPHVPIMFGDVIVVSSGKALHHLAIYGGGNTIWHATGDGGGVCTGNIEDPSITKHMIAVYRVR